MTARARFPKTAVAAALKKLGADPFAELVKLAQSTDDAAVAARSAGSLRVSQSRVTSASSLAPASLSAP